MKPHRSKLDEQEANTGESDTEEAGEGDSISLIKDEDKPMKQADEQNAPAGEPGTEGDKVTQFAMVKEQKTPVCDV